jgi:hypothetical protein
MNLIIIGIVVVVSIVISIVVGVVLSQKDSSASSDSNSDLNAGSGSVKRAWDNVPIGKSLNCNAGELVSPGAIYRYLGDGKVSWYPNPEIAGVLDPNWSSPTTIDCTGLTKVPNSISGNENDTANFNCAVKSGTIIYGTQPNNVVTFNVPVGSNSIQVTNATMGSDPAPGIFKKWGAYYTC